MTSLRKNQFFLITKTILEEEALSRNEVVGHSDDSRKLKLLAGAYYLPNEKKEKPLGKYAFFICNDKQTIGVADGVGGYAIYRINLGKYAHKLMNKAFNFVRNHPRSVDPMTVQNHAFDEESMFEGASIACIITVKDNTLHAVNVLVIRNGTEIVYISLIQKIFFNCPFQLGNSNCTNFSTNGDEMTFEVD